MANATSATTATTMTTPPMMNLSFFLPIVFVLPTLYRSMRDSLVQELLQTDSGENSVGDFSGNNLSGHFIRTSVASSVPEGVRVPATTTCSKGPRRLG